jgi:PDZ domain
VLKTALLLLSGAALALGAVALLGRHETSPAVPTEPVSAPGGIGSGSGTPLAERVAALETRLAAVLDEQRDLKTELAALNGALEQHDAPAEAAQEPEPTADERAPLLRVAGFRGAPDSADALAQRVERLVAAGFAPDRAQWLVQREAQLRMDALYSQYQAARDGAPRDPRTFLDTTSALRAEIGDNEYEHYLEATGRPTNVSVGQVLASSPAEQAGLQPGDRIVAYAGERVFDMRDINALTLKGEPGQAVAVDVLRDGATVQLYLPRGPIGIFGGGRRGP